MKEARTIYKGVNPASVHHISGDAGRVIGDSYATRNCFTEEIRWMG